MTKRERLEDLGKLSIMLKNIADNKIFNYAESKHGFEEWKKENYDKVEYDEPRGLYSIFHDIRYLHDEIVECLCIAYGEEDEH